MLWVESSAACNLNCDGCPTAAGRIGGNKNKEAIKYYRSHDSSIITYMIRIVLKFTCIRSRTQNISPMVPQQ